MYCILPVKYLWLSHFNWRKPDLFEDLKFYQSLINNSDLSWILFEENGRWPNFVEIQLYGFLSFPPHLHRLMRKIWKLHKWCVTKNVFLIRSIYKCLKRVSWMQMNLIVYLRNIYTFVNEAQRPDVKWLNVISFLIVSSAMF